MGFRSFCLIFLALISALFHGPASATDLGVESPAEYQQLVSAIRAAEYVRNDIVLADQRKPRVYGSLGALMAYAELNPNASSAQLSTFLQSFDEALKAYAPNDPELVNPATFNTALRFATVANPLFDGTDTRVGRRALALLGLEIIEAFDYTSLRNRMTSFELALARPLSYRNEVFDLLVAGFFGQDSAGNERPTLPALLESYFLTEGYDPELGTISIRADRADINAGLAVLPVDFAAFSAAIAVPIDSNPNDGIDNPLQANLISQMDSIKDQIDTIVGPTGTLQAALADEDTPGFQESFSIASDAVANPAGANADYIEQVVANRRAELEAVAEARAASSAATYMMLQSEFAEIGTYASVVRDFSEIALETNEGTADLVSGIQIVGSLGIAAAGAKSGNTTAAGAGLARAGGAVLDLVGRKVSEGVPSVDEQTFQQVAELRQQVAMLQNEMNDRFDRVDQQLQTLYGTVTNGFDRLEDVFNQVAVDVDTLVAEMASARSSLRRIEEALYGVTENVLLADLTLEINAALDYLGKNKIRLSYSADNPNFVSSSNTLFTYATDIPIGWSELALTVDNADILSGLSVSRYLNDLAELPEQLGLPALAALDIPAMEHWSQAASAYAQLARENPFYFRYRNPAGELTSMIGQGERIVSLVEAIRVQNGAGDSVTSSALFDKLIADYKTAVTDLQTEIDDAIFAGLDALFKNGGTTLDYWANGPQYSVDNLLDPLDYFKGDSGNDFPNLDIPSVASNKGFNTWDLCPCNTAQGPTEQVPYMQTWYLIQKEKAANPNDIRPRYRHEGGDGDYTIRLYLGTDGQKHPRVMRKLEYGMNIYLHPFWLASNTDDLDVIAGNFEKAWVSADAFFTRKRAGSNSDWAYVVIGNLSGETYSNGVGDGSYQIAPTSDSEELFPEFTAADIQQLLYPYRVAVRSNLIVALADEGSGLNMAAKKLNNIEALIDAYVSIGMPVELDESTVLRAALRAVPGENDNVLELGLRLDDVLAMIDDMDAEDAMVEAAWADQEYNVQNISRLLNERIDIVAAEIKLGLERPALPPNYVGWVLAELRDLQTRGSDVAFGDAYVTGEDGSISVTATAETDPESDRWWLSGLLANDARQGYSGEVSVDTEFENDPSYTSPANGSVTVSADGSFTYTANPGFEGFDRFTYRSTIIIPGVVDPVVSNIATVVIRTPGANLTPPIFVDGFEGE